MLSLHVAVVGVVQICEMGGGGKHFLMILVLRVLVVATVWIVVRVLVVAS